MQKSPLGSMRLSMPPPEEENARMKCRNCGAFGHTARSRRCPIKCSSVIVVPVSLGPNKEKENQNPRKIQNPQNPGLLSQAKREKETRSREEDPQRKNVPQKFPKGPQHSDRQSHMKVTRSPLCSTPQQSMVEQKDRKRPLVDHVQTSLPPEKKSQQRAPYPAETPITSPEQGVSSPQGKDSGENVAIKGITKPASRNYFQNPVLENLRGAKFTSRMHGMGEVRHSSSPALCPDRSGQPHLHSILNTSGQVLNLSSWVPGKKPLDVPLQYSQNPSKKAKAISFQNLDKSTARPASKAELHVQTPLQTSRLRLKETAKPRLKNPTPTAISDQEQPHSRTHLMSAKACLKSDPPESSQVPVQSLKMVFTRLHSDFWSSKLVTTTSAHDSEKQTPSSESTALLEKPEGPGCQVPGNVLFEDLQVSASSEDSDWD